MKKINKFLFTAGLMVVAACMMLASCTKEGPQGPAGADGLNGKDGTDGKDANETCKQCHAKAVVDAIAVEFELSKHSWGEAAFEEAGNTTCGPCHEQKAYVYVCENNTPSTFVWNSTTNKWDNSYVVPATDAIGDISCYTCHSELHTTYGTADLVLTNTAPVSMTMWGGAADKTIDLAQDGGISNLCVKCHQPRPLTATATYDPATRLISYDSLRDYPAVMFYDTTAGVRNKNIRPSYRMHVHYGTVGAVYAGKGGIEYTGSRSYENSPHTTLATCQDCHMADPMYGIAGGHSFNMRNAKETPLSGTTTWNFNGCNVEGCHINNPLNSGSDKWKTTRADVKALLDELATRINACGFGLNILHADATSANLWAGITTGNFDGYMDIYDASANPAGKWRNPAGPNSPPNSLLPKFPKLTNLQMGALINFQFCLREYSLGIHNTQYVKALLTNTNERMAAAGW